jgi:hypothetical protein
MSQRFQDIADDFGFRRRFDENVQRLLRVAN